MSWAHADLCDHNTRNRDISLLSLHCARSIWTYISRPISFIHGTRLPLPSIAMQLRSSFSNLREWTTTHREYHRRIYLNLHETYPNAANIDTCIHRCLLYNSYWPFLRRKKRRKKHRNEEEMEINSFCGCQ